MQLINEHIVISDNALEYLANFVNSRDFEGIFVLADETLVRGFRYGQVLFKTWKCISVEYSLHQ